MIRHIFHRTTNSNQKQLTAIAPSASVPLPTTTTSSAITILRHMREHRFESILQRPHVWVRILLQLKGVGDDFDRPVALFRGLAGLEAKEEVAWEFAVDAEGVHAAARIGFHVSGEPLF